MQADDASRQDEHAKTGRNPSSPQAGRPPAQRAEPGTDKERADNDPNSIPSGAPGNVIDNVGGPGLGVPPGGKNRSGKSGASGSTES